MNTTTVPATDEKNTLPQTIAPKKNIAYRILAVLFVALAVGAVFVPFTYVITYTSIAPTSLFEAVKTLFTGDAPQVFFKLFGFLPSYVPVEPIQGLYTIISFYLLLVCIVFTVIFGIATVFCRKRARGMFLTTAFFFTIGFAFYALHITVFILFHGSAVVLDFVCLGAAGFGALLYFIVACIRVKKTVIMNTVQFFLSLVFSLAIIYMIGCEKSTFYWGLNSLGVSPDWMKIIEKIVVGVCLLNVAIAAIRVATKKGRGADLFRYIIMMFIGGAFVYFQINAPKRDNVFLIIASATAGIALLQFILCCIQIGVAKKIKRKITKIIPIEEYVEPAQESATVKEETFVQEEYAEAVSYEGGPVEGVEVAEVVEEEAPAPAPAPAPAVETADYDYYNSKSFDPFIASLSTEERNQFTELFILKYKGTMPEIPDYEVGGNNKDFFRKVFIYLGQYRDRIPDGLLAKIYQFSVKM